MVSVCSSCSSTSVFGRYLPSRMDTKTFVNLEKKEEKFRVDSRKTGNLSLNMSLETGNPESTNIPLYIDSIV